jgi:hypothetical protein
MKEEKMGRICGTHGGRGEVFTGFWLGGSMVGNQWDG